MPDDPDAPFVDEEGFEPADAPPPWGTESRDARLARLLRTARDLPPVPGVYLMKDPKGVVLYVGKASRLCDRVSSYFLPSTDLGPNKSRMLDELHSFDTLRCDGDWEAILVENRLIKDIKPRFNTLALDDKSFPYLVITSGEDYPRVFVTRNPSGVRADGSVDLLVKNGRIYGPFVSGRALREAVQVLQRVFRFRTCMLDIEHGDPKNRRFRPCLLASIGRCTAPCNESIRPEAYQADINRLARFIGSKRSTMLREMRAEMAEASAAREFEHAAAVRDQIHAIEKLDERATREDNWQPEQEIGYIDPIKALRSLQRVLGIDRTIRCVEGIDIAHLQGGETVGSKVCFMDGRPFKNEYRRYRIKTVANDDYAAIREVVSRRYREAGAGEALYPDVILIDGGLGQLHAALQAFETLDTRPPMVISLAKKEELIYVQEKSEPVRLGRNNPALRLCQQVRDEAHRFAQHYHHVLRRKKTIGE